MALFVLVHGVCAGSWTWDLVGPHLERTGHATLAVDLPGDDPEAKFSDYADVVVRELVDHDAGEAGVLLSAHSEIVGDSDRMLAS